MLLSLLCVVGVWVGGALAVGAVLTLLVAWFAAGQWALYRLGSKSEKRW